VAGRGQTLLAMGRAQDALSDLSKATDLDSSLTDELRPYLTACNLPARKPIRPDRLDNSRKQSAARTTTPPARSTEQ